MHSRMPKMTHVGSLTEHRGRASWGPERLWRQFEGAAGRRDPHSALRWSRAVPAQRPGLRGSSLRASLSPLVATRPLRPAVSLTLSPLPDTCAGSRGLGTEEGTPRPPTLDSSGYSGGDRDSAIPPTPERRPGTNIRMGPSPTGPRLLSPSRGPGRPQKQCACPRPQSAGSHPVGRA